MKLELKHLAPYLPYDLKTNEGWVIGLSINEVITKEIGYEIPYYYSDIKPILIPLSDLTKEIEINGEKFVPIEFLAGRYNSECGEFLYRFKNNLSNIEDAPYTIINKLLEWHFDVYGLIEKSLAIDINTLK